MNNSAWLKKRIALISTGGTIEKTYDELAGVLSNRVSVLDFMLGNLILNGVEIFRVQLMNKDSLEMIESDYDLIADTARLWSQSHDGVVFVHGTDRLSESGHRVFEKLPNPESPIVFTGAMRPYELRNTDSTQNLTEALLAVQILPPGVYSVMHNRVLTFPGVVKDYEHSTFRLAEEPSP